jgi:hypothetical protein
MSTRDNAPPPSEWAPDCRCGVCHVCLPALSIPSNVILGTE